MNSYADYVSKRGDPDNNDEVWELSQSSLKTCDKNMLEEDHPERASTLLLAGRFAKRMGERSEADGKLQEALKLFLKRLGEHVRTVNALKEIGDFFLSGETDENLEKALRYYKRSEKMMDDMGMARQRFREGISYFLLLVVLYANMPPLIDIVMKITDPCVIFSVLLLPVKSYSKLLVFTIIKPLAN